MLLVVVMLTDLNQVHHSPVAWVITTASLTCGLRHHNCITHLWPESSQLHHSPVAWVITLRWAAVSQHSNTTAALARGVITVRCCRRWCRLCCRGCCMRCCRRCCRRCWRRCCRLRRCYGCWDVQYDFSGTYSMPHFCYITALLISKQIYPHSSNTSQMHLFVLSSQIIKSLAFIGSIFTLHFAWLMIQLLHSFPEFL